MTTGTNALLDIRNLTICYGRGENTVYAVDEVGLRLLPGQVLGIVGETGSGKTTVGLAVMRLLPPSARVLGGSIALEGVDLLALSERQMRRFRGSRIGMVFQNPIASLNPAFSVRHQIAEAITWHERPGRQELRARVSRLGERVGLDDRMLAAYPLELSGGQRQRAMIAIALACSPRLIIADEPTTALDVTIQAGILDLLHDLRDEEGVAMVVISHDLGVIAHLADAVLVMYGGRVVESGPIAAIFRAPQHPYTWSLLQAIPSLDDASTRLRSIPGDASALRHDGGNHCVFDTRCPFVEERCRRERPALREVAPGVLAACHFAPHIRTLFGREEEPDAGVIAHH